MNLASRTGIALAAILAAGAGGYWAGHRESLSLLGHTTLVSQNASREPSGQIIYYQDPNGLPIYSTTPSQTADGRAFLPVYANEALNVDTAATEPLPKEAGRKLLYYRNPMGLRDTAPAPKKDAMGMDYIPVYAGEDEDSVIIKLTPGKLQRTGVRSETVSNHLILRQVRVPGTVQPDERRVTVVSVPADSFISKVENVTTGDHVRKGEPLLQLYSSDIAAAAAQLLINPGYEGTRRRLQNLNVPAEVIAEIERARQVPLAFSWPSPRDGVVLERDAVEGKKIAAGDVLFRIADLSTIWVLADVPEYELASIEPGQSATIRVRSLPGRMFEGRVELIYPQINKETRTAKVRIEIANPDTLLLADMYADVEINAGAASPVIAVPNSAVIDTGTKQIVILDKGDGRFEPRDVEIGVHGDGLTQIREGITLGDRVVTSANFLIDAESNLKAALAGMNASEATP